MKSLTKHLRCRQAVGRFLLLATPLFLVGCERSEEQIVKGALTVSYQVQISETGTRTYDAKNFSEIQVLDHSVILISEDGKGGLVIPNSKLVTLTWRKK